ncbi:MarR family transcriptional regulator [Pseudonocardia sp.]|uniref:GbsR/MarR family transcriptional regulator n=1 Tax=Pseudonocardia sp. TaxID=60912 RepID=UPI002633DDCF|nr:MarR family transcriptional regulator [Pseudonocardia sp.]
MSGSTGPERQFAEEMALVFERFGVPRGAGRLLGWMLICEPARQSTAELVAALGLSKASVSTAVRLLESYGLITRVAVPGDRSDHYELLPDAFESAHSHLGTFRVFGDLMAKGLTAIGDADGPRAARLRESAAFYRFLENEWPAMVQRFRREYGEGEQDG